MNRPRSLTTLFLLSLLLLVFPLNASAEINPETSAEKTPEPAADVIDHSPFEALLTRYVDPQGRVAYARWHEHREDRQALSRYLSAIAEAEPEGHSDASRLAFYLNAYNALVLHDVLRRWPVESVIKVDGFFDAEKHRVAGQDLTLNELEHSEIIRAQFNEPRIHFVLVCAAIDCPRLRTQVLTATNLEAQLAAATAEFIPRATLQVDEYRIETSQLFNWYAEDFEKAAGSVANYLARFVTDPAMRRALTSDKVQISFSEYDWTINAR